MTRLTARGTYRLMVIVWMAVASLAGAYVLPTFSILRKMVEKRDESHVFTLRVDGTATLVGKEAREASPAGLPGDRSEIQLEGSFMLKLPGRCRFELNAPDSKVVAIRSRGQTRSEGKELTGISILLDEVCSLLAVRTSSEAEGRALIERHLHDLKVQTQKTSLGRLGGNVAYVIGDENVSKPQFWAYKDSFLPARVRFSDAQGTAWDVRFLDFSSPITGEWFPRNIELYQKGELLLRFTASHSDPRATLPDRLF